MKEPGAVRLVACHDLGHQPLAVAWPAAFLERAGYAPAVMDVSVEPFDAERVRRAKLVAISVPMHTAPRLGVAIAERVRTVTAACHIAFYGLYATLNADHLLAGVADSVMSGEIESTLVDLAQRLGSSQHRQGDGEGSPASVVPKPRASGLSLPVLQKLSFPVPSRANLPSLKKYAHLERDGGLEVVGYVEASRGGKHMYRPCPIPPVYGGRVFGGPPQVLLPDIPHPVGEGAPHVTRCDPRLLHGPGHSPP